MEIDTDKKRKQAETLGPIFDEVKADYLDALDEIDKLRKQLKSYPNYEKRQ